MAMTLHLDIVSAEEKIFSGRVENLSVTGQEGGLGIFPGHTPLLTGIQPGEIIVTQQGGKKAVFFVSGGMLEVQPETVTVLADTVMRAEDIDKAAAEEARRKARDHYEEQKKTKIDYEASLVQLQEASAKLRVLKTLKEYTDKHRTD
jgi:F-type H+-transporting ATPase subunit epsilon